MLYCTQGTLNIDISLRAVKEKEDLHPDLESQGIHDDTFCEYR